MEARTGSTNNAATLQRLLTTHDQRIAGDVTLQQANVTPLATGGAVVRLAQPVQGAQLAEVKAALEQLPGVTGVTKNSMKHQFLAAPNDPMAKDQWHLDNPFGGMGIRPAHSIATGEGIKVGVIDTGIVDHSDLNANVLGGYDMITKPSISRDGDGRDANPQDEGTWHEDGECGGSLARESSWHGTHVAGTIGAIANNNKGVAGVAPNAKIVPIRMLGKCGGTTTDMIDSIIWAAGGDVPNATRNPNPVDIINMSLGGEDACSAEEQKAIDFATSRGITVVVAAGNSNDDSSKYSPGNCRGVITVASNNASGAKASYSNYGSTIEIAGPGGTSSDNKARGVLATVDRGTTSPRGESYKTMVGTSMAAPNVAGVVALLRSTGKVQANQVLDVIQSTARPMYGPCDEGCGAGIIDAYAALRKATGTNDFHHGEEAIVNGGFENGSQGWTANRDEIFSTGGEYPAASGRSKAVLAGQKFPRTYELKQRVTIPRGKNANLRFDVQIDSEDRGFTNHADTMSVTLGGETLLDTGDLDRGKRYVQANFDVSKFAGRTVDLVFSAKEDSFRKTGFLIDNVSLKTNNSAVKPGKPNKPGKPDKPVKPVKPGNPVDCSALPGTMDSTVSNGGTRTLPKSGYYRSWDAGVHSFCVSGGSADLDLQLQQWSNRKWVTVAETNAPGTNDLLTHDGASGYFRLNVISRNNAGGDFKLHFGTPK